MKLLTTKHFNGYALDCYVEPEYESTGDFWTTREQIGTLLEYENPADAIGIIHHRNKERLDKFSSSFNLKGEAGMIVVTIYSFKGLLEICRYSNQPKADAIMDWLWDVADEIRCTGSYSLHQVQDNQFSSDMLNMAKIIFEAAKIKGNQLALALDKVGQHYTGESMLALAGITLIAPVQCQMLNPTQIGKHFGASARKVNQVLLDSGYQVKTDAGY